MHTPSLQSRFRGALLGTLIGDALGRPFEGMAAGDHRLTVGLARRLGSPGVWMYSDDTQMMIALAESLLARGGLDPLHLIETLALRHDPGRGYGKGMNLLIRAYRAGEPSERLPFVAWEEGSSGSGAAARIAPLACLFCGDVGALARLADESARITHAHPIGRAGAVAQGLAIARVLAGAESPRALPGALLDELAASAASTAAPLAEGLLRTRALLDEHPSPVQVVERLGNGVTAEESVPAALFAFLSSDGDFARAITAAIGLGGDTDTIGAMTGAVAGALVGDEGIPADWLARAEDGPQGRGHVVRLADRLAEMAATPPGKHPSVLDKR